MELGLGDVEVEEGKFEEERVPEERGAEEEEFEEEGAGFSALGATEDNVGEVPDA